MASVDVAFKTNKVYNVTKFDVVLGEKFTIFLIPDKEGESRWGWFNDPVLATKVIDHTAQVEATEVGTSVVYIYQGDGRGDIIMELTINVVEAILAPASKLIGTAGEARPKRPE